MGVLASSNFEAKMAEIVACFVGLVPVLKFNRIQYEKSQHHFVKN